VLRTLCPFCTLVHICNAIGLWYAWRLYTSQTISSIFVVIYELRRWAIVWAAIFALPVLVSALQTRPEFPHESIDRCLYEKHATMYGATACGYCQQQKKLLGESFGMVTFVDCAREPLLCSRHKVGKYPTWLVVNEEQEVKRFEGVMPLEKLAVFYDCPPAAAAAVVK